MGQPSKVFKDRSLTLEIEVSGNPATGGVTACFYVFERAVSSVAIQHLRVRVASDMLYDRLQEHANNFLRRLVNEMNKPNKR